MSKKRIEVYDDVYQKHPINASRAKNQPCDRKLLNRFEGVFDGALAGHAKVMMFRYDVRFPESYECGDANKKFAQGQADAVKYLSRKKLSPKYFAVRESSNGDRDHFHTTMFVDASKSENPYGHLKKIEKIFERKLGLEADGSHGLVNFCDKDRDGKPVKNFYIIHRGNQKEADVAFERASYLAKIHTKTDDGNREMFASVNRRTQKQEQDK